MTITLEKQNKLRSIFSRLPESATNSLRSAFKSAFSDGDPSLPYDILLGLLPPVKIETKTNLEKIFYPVSNLACDEARYLDQVSYKMLEDVWAFFSVDKNPTLARSWKKSTSSLVAVKKQVAIELRSVWEEEGAKARLSDLFGEENVAKIPIFISLLSFSEEIEELILSWPALIKELDDHILLPLRDLNDLLVDTDPQITLYLLFLLKVHLDHPQHILRAIKRLTRQNSDIIIVNTEMNLIVISLLDEAEYLLEQSLLPVRDDQHATQIASSLSRFANIIAGSIDEFEIDPNGVWGKRLYSISKDAIRKWTKRVENAWDAIEMAIPRSKTKSFLGGSLTGPDLSAVMSEQIIDRAVLDATLLAQIFPYASKIGFSACRDEIDKLIADRINQSEDDLIRLIADPGENDLGILQHHFSALVRIISAYQGEDIAKVLRRRGVSAAA